MNDELELSFVGNSLTSYLNACEKLSERGKRTVRIRPFNQFACSFVEMALAKGIRAQFCVTEAECEVSLTRSVNLCSDDSSSDATILFIPDAEKLSFQLMEYLDIERGSIVAPITEHYHKKRPLFLISIPKGGSHLLYNLAETFGYESGVVCPDRPLPGTWYCVEYSNSHTSAKDFFIDTVRRSPFGNRDHPFLRSPAVFIYRNPLDILLSEANYYHRDGKTAFSGYLANKPFQDRLLTLIDDPWLLGSIRERIGNFIPWLEFQNVIPVSFEEIVGPKGGGSLEVQMRVIWSLQLKLHVPGNPQVYAERLFNGESPTFFKGQVGGYKTSFTREAFEKFLSLPQDFMEQLGYNLDGGDGPAGMPKRAEEFRRRPLLISATDFEDTPIGVEYSFLGYNIVKYRGRFWGIPLKLKQVNLANQKDLDFLKKIRICSAKDLNSLKKKLLFRTSVLNLFPIRRWAVRLGSLSRLFHKHFKGT